MTYKVGPKGQVVIPKRIRDRVGIGPGDRVMVDEDHGAVRIRKTLTDSAERRAILAGLCGALRDGGHDLLTELEADHRREVEADQRERRKRRL
jgi:AbrB family looped-hinge helix DNA binding protein